MSESEFGDDDGFGSVVDESGRAREKFGLGIQDPRLGPCRGSCYTAST